MIIEITVPDDENVAEYVGHIAGLLDEGYTSGYIDRDQCWTAK